VDEKDTLRQYNEVLFRKLEKKVHDLETEVAQRKAVQQQLEAAVRELEQKNAELARFTYTVSHEIRSPLITIQGFAGVIEEEAARGACSEDLRDYAHRISTAVEKMETLLSDLLKLSRAGRSIGPPAPVMFGTIVREARELFPENLEERGVYFEIEAVFPEVFADKARIRQVLVILLENAIKFGGEQRDHLVRIGVDKTGTEPVFFVQDNGIGIEPRYLERIFGLFEKLDSTSEGTGVGLAIARRIIEAHGGKIWAESGGAGKGSTFRFTLPGSPGPDNR
jgi:signal transduction histidine kinase